MYVYVYKCGKKTILLNSGCKSDRLDLCTDEDCIQCNMLIYEKKRKK